MKKVKVTRFGIVHYTASCTDCDFHDASHVDRESLRKRIRKHVAQTGHTVSLETGSATHYSIKQNDICLFCSDPKCKNAECVRRPLTPPITHFNVMPQGRKETQWSH